MEVYDATRVPVGVNALKELLVKQQARTGSGRALGPGCGPGKDEGLDGWLGP